MNNKQLPPFQNALESRKNCKFSGKPNSTALTGVLSAKQGEAHRGHDFVLYG